MDLEIFREILMDYTHSVENSFARRLFFKRTGYWAIFFKFVLLKGICNF